MSLEVFSAHREVDEKTLKVAAIEFSPDKRIIAIAPTPDEVAKAIIVSLFS
jgi:hypothetical protein